jgi:hypothetical protein
MPIYEDDVFIETRAKAIDALQADLDVLDDFIRMLHRRGCPASVRKGIRQMQQDWIAQLDVMTTHQAAVTPASQKPSVRADDAR